MSTPIKPAIAHESGETIQPRRAAPTPGGARQVAHLAYPVILTHLSITLMGVVDSAMLSRLGATELAAVGLMQARTQRATRTIRVSRRAT